MQSGKKSQNPTNSNYIENFTKIANALLKHKKIKQQFKPNELAKVKMKISMQDIEDILSAPIKLYKKRSPKKRSPERGEEKKVLKKEEIKVNEPINQPDIDEILNGKIRLRRPRAAAVKAAEPKVGFLNRVYNNMSNLFSRKSAYERSVNKMPFKDDLKMNVINELYDELNEDYMNLNYIKRTGAKVLGMAGLGALNYYYPLGIAKDLIEFGIATY